MSVQAIAWALEQSTGSVTRKAVLLCLANRVNSDTGLCCPSVKLIAAETELGRSTVIRAMHELEQAGFITRVERHRENGSQASNEYRFPRITVTPPPSRSGTPPSPAVTPLEPEVRTGTTTSLGEGVKPGRARNDIWDALETMFGPAVTRSEQTKRGKVVASLREAGATPSEMFARAKRWPRHYENATLTENALEKHWSTLDPSRKPLRRQ